MVINTAMIWVLIMMVDVTWARFELEDLLHDLHCVARFAAVQWMMAFDLTYMIHDKYCSVLPYRPLLETRNWYKQESSLKRAIWTQMGREAYRNTFLTSTLSGGERLHCPKCCIQEKESRRLGGPKRRGNFWKQKNLLIPTGIQIGGLQHIVVATLPELAQLI
jgi:hypothetical protein